MIALGLHPTTGTEDNTDFLPPTIEYQDTTVISIQDITVKLKREQYTLGMVLQTCPYRNHYFNKLGRVRKHPRYMNQKMETFIKSWMDQ